MPASPGPLQAVVLAAGYGRRMRPLSDNCHKALLPVGGTTILDRIMDGLAAIDVQRVTVVTGYRADDIEAALARRTPKADLRFVRNARYAETNNVVSLSLALDDLEYDADVLLIECDLLFDPSLLARLVDRTGNVALVDRYRAGMDGTVVAVRDGLLTEVFPTSVQGADFDYTDKFKTLNIYRFDREFCRATLRPLLATYAQLIDPSSYYELVLGMLVNLPAHRIAAEVVSGERWVEVDDPNDLAVAEFRFDPPGRAPVLDRAFGGHWNFDVLDFSFMRNAYFPTGAMLAAMRFALPELVASYGSAQPILNEKLALFLGCDPSRVQVLHGATQAFPILGRHLDGAPVAIPTPTFGEYPRTFPGATAYPDGPGIEVSDLAARAQPGGVLVVVNPNTPTGTTLPTETLYRLAAEFPQTLLWVDESFLAFSTEPSIIELLERDPLDNVVVLTSLSKCFGVPGLRLGYVYTANRGVADAVAAALPVWNLGSLAEFFLELLIKFRPAYAESLAATSRDRVEFAGNLAELAVVDHVHPSGGNFLLTCLTGERPEVAERLRRRLLEADSIETKNVTNRFPDQKPRLRLAVRTRAENARLIAALRRWEV